MPPIPSLSSAFSALGKAAPSLSFGMANSTPSFIAPKAPAAPKPAVPYLGNSQSSFTALTPGQFGGSVMPAVPKVTTPTVPVAKAPVVPAQQGAGAASAPAAAGNASAPAVPNLGGYTPSPYVTTPSGATVDPNTGALVSPAPTGTNASYGGGASLGTYGGTQGYGTAPTLPSFSGNPLITNPQYEQAYSAYQAAATPSQQEIQAMTDKANLDASLRMAYTNTDNQPIALEFQTGQKAAEQRSYNALSAPLEATLATAQAKRQLAMTASQTALQRESDKLAAARDLAKPVSTAYGGTLSRYNPQTGQYETVVNPFGTADQGSGGTSVTDSIGSAMAEGRLSADQVTRYGIPFIVATLQKDPGYNFITQKASVSADTASLKTQQQYSDSTSRAFNTANANLSQLKQFMVTSGVNSGSVPIANTLANKVKAGATDPGTIAAFNAALAGLRAEYAQVLSRGGEVTDGQRNAAATLIPDNISPDQLQQVADRLNVEGNNAIKEANDKVKEIQARIGTQGGSGGSSSGGSGGTGSSLYDF